MRSLISSVELTSLLVVKQAIIDAARHLIAPVKNNILIHILIVIACTSTASAKVMAGTVRAVLLQQYTYYVKLQCLVEQQHHNIGHTLSCCKSQHPII